MRPSGRMWVRWVRRTHLANSSSSPPALLSLPPGVLTLAQDAHASNRAQVTVPNLQFLSHLILLEKDLRQGINEPRLD